MRLIEIDVVGLKPVQRPLDGLVNVGRGQADLARPHLHADLGGDHDLGAVAGFFQPIADDGFRLAAFVAGGPAGIDVGRVDQVEAGRDGGVEQLERHGFVGGPAENVAAERERADLRPRLAKAAW